MEVEALALKLLDTNGRKEQSSTNQSLSPPVYPNAYQRSSRGARSKEKEGPDKAPIGGRESRAKSNPPERLPKCRHRLFDSDGLGPAIEKSVSEITISHQEVIPPHLACRPRPKKKHSQIPREINIKPVHNRQVVAKQLQRDNIQNPLEAVDRAGDYNLAPAGLLESRVVLATDDDWLTLAGSNLREG